MRSQTWSLYNFHLFTFWLGHPNLPSMPLVHFQFGNFTNAQNPWILIPPGLALNWFHSHGTREISSVEFFFLTALLRLKTISWNQKSYSAIFFICSILRYILKDRRKWKKLWSLLEIFQALLALMTLITIISKFVEWKTY